MNEKLVIVSLGDVGCGCACFFSNFWLSIKIIFSKALLIINHHLCHYFDQADQQRTKQFYSSIESNKNAFDDGENVFISKHEFNQGLLNGLAFQFEDFLK
jgi:hypothetical protein